MISPYDHSVFFGVENGTMTLFSTHSPAATPALYRYTLSYSRDLDCALAVSGVAIGTGALSFAGIRLGGVMTIRVTIHVSK